LPGEPEEIRQAKGLQEGVVLSDGVVEDLEKLAADLGVKVPWVS